MKSKLMVLLSLFAVQAQASWVSTYFQWTDLGLGNGYVQRGDYVRAIPTSNSLEQLRLNYGSTALKRIYARMNSQQVTQNNENLLKLAELDVNLNTNGFRPMGDSLTSLNRKQIQEIYYAMTGSMVVRNQRKYGGRGVGFCFGRALVAHNQALIRNVHPAAIRKIWVIGDMGFWGHHVATIVRSEGTWVAVDNYTGIVTVEDWLARMKEEQKGSKPLGFFITRAGRFGHQTNSLYNTIDLFNVPTNRMNQYASTEAKNALKSRDFYKGFFMDFYETLEEDAALATLYSEREAQEERAERARVEAARAAEIAAAQNSVKVEDVSQYQTSQETLYCFNTENKKLNCNYQLSQAAGAYETSVSLSGYAQYQVQNHDNEKIYAKHIISTDLEDESYQIVEDDLGHLTKRIVVLVKPEVAPIRPYLKVVSEDRTSTQEQLAAEVMQIKDILATFNTDYQVTAENASPLVRIQNAEQND